MSGDSLNSWRLEGGKSFLTGERGKEMNAESLAPPPSAQLTSQTLVFKSTASQFSCDVNWTEGKAFERAEYYEGR